MTSWLPPPRRPEQLSDLVADHGDRIHPIALDVTDAAAARAAIAGARDHFGRLHVIVNNAGYANVSPIETTEDEDFRAQFETNFWGVYNVSKAAIPVLRAQAGGIVMQFSSIGGRVGGSPGIASYQAAKFAIDGSSRVLQAETAPFGVKVIVVEPSGFKTDWAGSSMMVRDIPEAYAATVGAMNTRVRQNPDGPPGDPVRAAELAGVAGECCGAFGLDLAGPLRDGLRVGSGVEGGLPRRSPFLAPGWAGGGGGAVTAATWPAGLSVNGVGRRYALLLGPTEIKPQLLHDAFGVVGAGQILGLALNVGDNSAELTPGSGEALLEILYRGGLSLEGREESGAVPVAVRGGGGQK